MTPKEISIEVSNILSTITTENGYPSNAGKKVYRGRLNFDESMVPCIVLGEADDNPVDQNQYGRQVIVNQRFVVDAWVPCDPDNPNDAAHDAISDIKRLLFQNVNAMGAGGVLNKIVKKIKYVGRSIGPRPEGGEIVRGTVIFEVTYTENLAP